MGRKARNLTASWCIRRSLILRGRSDKWRKGSLLSFLAVLEQATAEEDYGGGADLEKRDLVIIVLTFFKVCHHGRWSCNRRTFQELLSCGVRRKMVCWGGVRPRPGPRLPPLEGGGQAAMHWAACCPPTGAQVTGETCLLRMLSGRALVQEG